MHPDADLSGAHAPVFRIAGQCTGLCRYLYKDHFDRISLFDLFQWGSPSGPGGRYAQIFHALQPDRRIDQYGSGPAAYLRIRDGDGRSGAGHDHRADRGSRHDLLLHAPLPDCNAGKAASDDPSGICRTYHVSGTGVFLQSDCHDDRADRAEQLSDLLRRTVGLWGIDSAGVRRNHLQGSHAVFFRGHRSGTGAAAHCRIQLRSEKL